MTTANKTSYSEECEKIRNFGYATSKHITIYGEHFEIMSDPFPEGEGIAVHAISRNSSTPRILRLPVSILVGLKDLLPKTTRLAEE
jgi:hypothetical protein